MRPSICPKPPGSIKAGAELRRGRFWHNLRAADLRKRYSNDRDESPEYGWRLLPWKWLWKPDGLSANIETCACSPCSVRLQGDTSQVHAVLVDLERLSDEACVKLLAQYQPLEGDGNHPPNVCHFLFVGEDDSFDECQAKITVKFKELDARFPGGAGAKVPQSLPDRAKATEEANRFLRAFKVVRNAHGIECNGPAEEDVAAEG